MRVARAVILPFVVTIWLLTAVYGVTTANAQAVAPAQCEWPVAGNQVQDGLGATGAGWYKWDAVHQITVSNHPCGYTTGIELVPFVPGGAENPWAVGLSWGYTDSVRVSFWHRAEVQRDASFLIGVSTGGGVGLVSTPIPDDNEWRFASLCRDLSEINLTDPLQDYITFQGSDYQITGLSIVIGDEGCTPPPTAVPTATPTISGTIPAPVPTITPTAMPTAVSLDLSPNPLPTGRAFELPGLPALPEPFEITKPEHTLELTGLFEMANITLVFQIVRTVPALAEQMPGWPLLMFSAVVIISLRFFVRHNKRTKDAERAEERRANAIGTDPENNRSEGL